MKIAALNPDPANKVNPIYRTVLPMTELARRGHDVYLCQGEEPNPRQLLEFDVVCFWRAYQPPEIAITQMLERAGVPVVWDDDDDVAGIPRNDPSYRLLGGGMGVRRFQQSITTIMRGATLVTAPNRVLAERFSAFSGTPARVLENYLPDAFVQPSDAGGDGVTVAWVAGLEHRIDADQLGLARILRDLLQELPQLRLVTVGVKLDLRHERYEAIGRVEYEDLPAFLQRADIGIAPLVDVRYNQARSNVKLKEYAASGLAWLASPIGPYAGLGEGEGGRLVADGDWPEALSSMVRDARGRRKLAKRAVKWARGQTIGRNVHRWETVLEEAVELASAARALRA